MRREFNIQDLIQDSPLSNMLQGRQLSRAFALQTQSPTFHPQSWGQVEYISNLSIQKVKKGQEFKVILDSTENPRPGWTTQGSIAK